MKQLGELGEFGLIRDLARRLEREPAAPTVGKVCLGIGDDAAILELPPEHRLVVTADALIEDVHFRRDWSSARELGWKALAVNVSDLGAMGARPVGAVVTLGLPRGTDAGWVRELYAGLGECAKAYGCPIVGGDTVRAPTEVALSVTALGAVPAGRAVTRAGARPGDLVCVTGVLGESGAGLALLQGGKLTRLREFEKHCVAWHRRPEPPAAAGAVLAERGLATAMLDLSDGLASDLQHLARESEVGVRIQAERLPISDATRLTGQALGVDPVEWALYGGEDYQLLFTVSPERFGEAPPALGPLGVTVTRIGEVTRKGVELELLDGTLRPLEPLGFQHFRKEAGTESK